MPTPRLPRGNQGCIRSQFKIGGLRPEHDSVVHIESQLECQASCFVTPHALPYPYIS